MYAKYVPFKTQQLTKVIKIMNIKPFDTDIKERLLAVSIVNDFRYLGCRTRADFVACVTELDSSFDTEEKRQHLVHFWNGRNKSLIAELAVVLNKLKSIKDE